jgi:hypothetical protein
MKKVDTVFVCACAVATLSVLAFPYVGHRWTVLAQVVVLVPWSLVAYRFPGFLEFANHHHAILWAMAAVMNAICFCIVSVPVWAMFHRRRQNLGFILIGSWTAFYFALLFFLFPAQ